MGFSSWSPILLWEPGRTTEALRLTWPSMLQEHIKYGTGAGQAPATGDQHMSADEAEGGHRPGQPPCGMSRADDSRTPEQPIQVHSSESLANSGADDSSGAGDPQPLKDITEATGGSAAADEPAAAALVQPCHPQAGSPAAPPQPVPAKPRGTSERRAQPGQQRKQRGCCARLRRLLAPCCGGRFGHAPSTGVSPSMAGSRGRQPSRWDRDSWKTSTGEGMGRVMDSASCEVPAGSLPGAEDSTPTLVPTSADRWAGVQPHIIAQALDSESVLAVCTGWCNPCSASLPSPHSGSAMVHVRVPDTYKHLQGLHQANKGAS